MQGSRGAGGLGKDEGGRMKDENQSEEIDSSFIPHPSSLILSGWVSLMKEF